MAEIPDPRSALTKIRDAVSGDIESYRDSRKRRPKVIKGGHTRVRKGLVTGGEDDSDVVAAPNQRPSVEAEQNFFLGAGALIPRYDPWACASLYEKSSALRPCVESYSTNVHGFGFKLVPVIDLDKSDAGKRVEAAIRQERLAKGDSSAVTPEDVANQIGVIKREAELEEFDLVNFFAYCCPDLSFVALRMQTCGTDAEATGNAYWEVVRNGVGKIQFFAKVDSITMRLRAVDQDFMLVETNEKISPIKYRKRAVPRRFRTYVQLVNGLMAVYFKEFGDPRVLSATHGVFYKSRAALRRAEGEDAIVATEILHWKVPSPIGPYGVPRWVGATMNVLGLRASEEINYSYFDNKTIPPYAILVNGGSLKKGAVEKIKAHLKEQKGRENFHEALIIEAESSANANPNVRCHIELKSLKDAGLQDALFQIYEENSSKKIGKQYRLPSLLRGESEETNRAQAQAVLQFAEGQVFQPLREDFDHVMNRRVLADMGIRYWTFQTQSAIATDPTAQTQIVCDLVKASILTPGDARPIAGDILNREYSQLPDDWTKRPIALTLAGVTGGGDAPGQTFAPSPGGVTPPEEGIDASGTEKGGTDALATRLLTIQTMLRQLAGSSAAARVLSARSAEATHRLVLSQKQFDELAEADAE